MGGGLNMIKMHCMKCTKIQLKIYIEKKYVLISGMVAYTFSSSTQETLRQED